MASKQSGLLTKGTFHEGVIRDTARHAAPAAGIYNAVDYLIHRPGIAEKRGGTERHSAVLGASTSVGSVATIHIPTRVVAVGSDGNLYDVTSESSPQATSVSAAPTPSENPPLYIDFLVYCFPDASAAPKKVYTTGGGGTVAITNLGGSPPSAAHSAIYASRILLGRGTVASGFLNRWWFSDLPDPESSWSWNSGGLSFLDVSNEITGGIECNGVFLSFSPVAIERILGGVPPGVTGENMELQPVAGVGCLDGRSIVRFDRNVVFAGQEGVWITDGNGVKSLTQGRIQTYWRSLFASDTVRQLIGGMVNRDFYILSMLDASSAGVDTLLCHIPSGAWARCSNMAFKSFAQGRDEQENLELYGASATDGYVYRIDTILKPVWSRKLDGNSTVVAPVLEVTLGDAGSLKKIGGGRLSHAMTVGVSTAWAADTVTTLTTLIYEEGAVWEATARAGDFKTGVTEPVWTTAAAVGATIVDDMVTWTNRGPQLILSTAPTLDPASGDFTTREALTVPSGTTRRSKFSCFYDQGDNAQAVTVRVTQSGASATTAIYGIDLLVDDVLESEVTGGQ